LADESLEQLVHIVLVVGAVLLEDFVAEVGAGFEGEELGLGERVVAVEEDVVNLRVGPTNISSGVIMPVVGSCSAAKTGER
jgi:hypothetical protein